MMPATLPRLLLAALLGVSTSSALYFYRHSLKTPSPEPTRPVVIVKKAVGAGMRVPVDALELQQRPTRYLPAGALEQVSAAVGREAKWPLVPGEPVLETRLARPGEGAHESLPIPAGRRGVTVAVNEVSGVGGFVRPGSVVDVIATWDVSGVAHAKLLLQRLTVLAVSQESEPTDPPKAKVATSVTLAVRPDQAETLVLASERGTIRLAMRSPGETAEATTPGLTTRSLTGEAPTPVPPREPSLRRAAHPARRHAHRPHSRPARPSLQSPPSETPIVVIRGPEGPAQDP